MPVITVIILFVVVGLTVMLMAATRNRKKLKLAHDYGHTHFDIHLPDDVVINTVKEGYDFPAFANMTDGEAFLFLITPYLGSLSVIKREFMLQHINDLKNELKMNKDIYQNFIDEYKIYEGLTEAEAAEKWAGK